MNKILYTAVLLLFSRPLLAQPGLVLNGTLTGFEDSVRLIINKCLKTGGADMENEITIYLHDGKFSFRANITEPTKYSIRVRPKNISDENFVDFENLFVWAENKEMVLTGYKGVIEFAHVTGSEIQNQFEEYVNLNKPLKIRNKQITDSVRMYPNLPTETKAFMRQVFQSNNTVIENANLDFIYKHPEYLFTEAELAFRIKTNPDHLSKNDVAEFYGKLSSGSRNNDYGKTLSLFVGGGLAYKKLAIGETALDFSLQDAFGKSISLSSLKGKTVLLDFWFAACAPCRAEHKNYLNAYQMFNKDGFEILSVSIDARKDQWLTAMQQDNMIWKAAWDKKKKVTNGIYHVMAFPSNYLINGEGIVIDKDVRGVALFDKLNQLFSH